MSGIVRITKEYNELNGITFWYVYYESGRRKVYMTGNGGTLSKSVKDFIDTMYGMSVETRLDENTVLYERR